MPNKDNTPEIILPSENLPDNQTLRKVSGNIIFDNSMTAFLYLLMRDHLPVGKIEGIIRQIEKGRKDPNDSSILYSNGWLAQYAEYCANRLIPKSKKKPLEGA